MRSASPQPGRRQGTGPVGGTPTHVHSRGKAATLPDPAGRNIESRLEVQRAVPLPQRLARFNRVVTNRVAFPAARRVPGFGVVLHTGRRSGRSYRTPVNAFRTRDGYVIALT